MKVTSKDIGGRFRVGGRYGHVVLVSLSADGTLAFVDTKPGDSRLGGKGSIERYEQVPVGQLRRARAGKGVPLGADNCPD